MLKFIKDFFFGKKEDQTAAPYKVEAPVVALGEPPSTVVVEGAGQISPSWHTAPATDTAPVSLTDVLDVNHDGKVDLADVKAAVKRGRKPKAAKAEPAPKPKATAKKTAGKKPAAMKAKTKPKSKKA